MKVLSIGAVVTIAFASNIAIAGEKESAKMSLPGASMEVTKEYSGTKKEYDKAVKDKEHALKTEGGKAMVNEAKQPTKDVTVKTEVGGTFMGSGGSVSNEKPLGKTSAAEDALRNHEKNKK